MKKKNVICYIYGHPYLNVSNMGVASSQYASSDPIVAPQLHIVACHIVHHATYDCHIIRHVVNVCIVENNPTLKKYDRAI